MFQIYNEDCLQGLKRITDGAVDMILDDLPFGTTDCEFDKRFPLEQMWEQFKRVTKPNAAIVLFSQMPFGAELIMSNRKMFRHEWIYNKPLAVGYLNAHKMPLRAHENILVFYGALPTYNPQFTQGKPYSKMGGNNTSNYRHHKSTRKESDGRRYPLDVLRARQPYCEGGELYHPQQKPVSLLEYLIKTYTNEGETVLDATMGSGSTGVAAVNTGRKFIGFELTEKYFEIAQMRLEQAAVQYEKLFARLRDGGLKIVDKPTAELTPYENNPRINDRAVDAVAKSIAEFGFKVPIVIDSAGVIICGHTRFKAAQKLKLDKVPCIIADDLTADEIKAFRLVDNKTSELASWAIDDLNAELAELSNFNMEGFSFDTNAEEVIYDSPEYFSDNFQMTFRLHKNQAALIQQAMN